jgi:hypothetical protein
MLKRIVVLDEGLEKKDLAAGGCCAAAPAGKFAK